MQITTYRPNAVVTAAPAMIETITLPNARSLNELFEVIAEGSATTTDILRFVRKLGDHLTKDEWAMVEYATARAFHRENRPLSVRQVVLLTSMTAKMVINHMRQLKIQLVDDLMSANDATRVMFRDQIG